MTPEYQFQTHFGVKVLRPQLVATLSADDVSEPSPFIELDKRVNIRTHAIGSRGFGGFGKGTG